MATLTDTSIKPHTQTHEATTHGNPKDPMAYATAAIDTMLRTYPDPAELPIRDEFMYWQGVFLSGVANCAAITGEIRWLAYIQRWCDEMIDVHGRIRGLEPYCLDSMQPGILLYPLIDRTGDPRYTVALDHLVRQIDNYPRTREGGLWHNLRSPDQMWLDGLYMGGPLLTEYAERTHRMDLTDLVADQVIMMRDRTRDEATGLWKHAYDAERLQPWADPVTGLSSQFWGRSMGWVPVAILDDLDHIPAGHPKRAQLESIVRDLLVSVCRYQGEDGRWWQVLDKPAAAGNWPENSCTCLFANAIFRAVDAGILDETYRDRALAAWEGVTGTITFDGADLKLGHVCVGTNIGDYAYYCNRKVSVNDPHGMGSFLLLCATMHNTANEGN